MEMCPIKLFLFAGQRRSSAVNFTELSGHFRCMEATAKVVAELKFRK